MPNNKEKSKMTIVTLIITDEPISKFVCDGSHGCKAHGSVLFANRSDALEWLNTNKFKPADGEGDAVFRRGRFATAIISTVN